MKKAVKQKLSILMLSLLPVAVMADSPTGDYFSGTEINCPGIEFAESNVIACNKMAYETADKELNLLYGKLMKAADENEKTLLKNMQRAWLKFKDAQCSLVESYYADSPQSEKWTTQCAAIMTIRRVNELKELGTGIDW